MLLFRGELTVQAAQVFAKVRERGGIERKPDEEASGAAVMSAVADVHHAVPRLRERGA